MALLADGSALAAGGTYDFTDTLSSAELYSSVNGVWAATGSLNTARMYFQMVTLTSGSCLAAGGLGLPSGQGLKSAELYDPVAMVWSITGPLITTRFQFRMVLLPNGNVLAAGGRDGTISDLSILSSAEIYNVATGNWLPTGSLNTARAEFEMTVLPSGEVLAVGGYGSGSVVLDSTEIYDPFTGVWSVTGSLNVARADFRMALLPNGQVLVAGGASSGNIVRVPQRRNEPSLSSSEIFDPKAQIWSATGPLVIPLSNLEMIAL